MLKDNIAETMRQLEEAQRKDKNMDEMKKMRGELEILAYKNGELIHHDKQHNVVTNWAKHATMHLMTGEIFSTHGDRTIDTYAARSRRSSTASDHILDTSNNDGTLISNEQYLGDNTYYDKYWSLHNDTDYPVNIGNGDATAGTFNFAFNPTKMLFGTGIEYPSWQTVIDDGRDGSGQDGYGNASNGSWTQSTFDDLLNDTGASTVEISNYYSALWDGTGFQLTKCRTVNDVYSSALSDAENPLDEDSFAVKGAIKDATFNGANDGTVLTTVDGKYFAANSYRGIGQPSFIYATRESRFMSDGDVTLELGTISGTESLESKITFTVIMPEQTGGEFYPYNGYTLKQAGLFGDAAMLLSNTVPIDNNDNDDTLLQEYSNYQKLPCGIMWATRNIAPIFKSHDTQIIAKWSIYL